MFGQSPLLENKTQRLLRAVERAKQQFAKTTARMSSSEHPTALSSSPINRLPIELVLSILTLTPHRTIARLRLVCKSFRDLIDTNEVSIVTSQLQRLSGTDISLLSTLFPPPKSRENGRRRPTLQYMSTLEHRQSTCRDLAYYLCDCATAPLFGRKSTGIPGLRRSEERGDKEKAIDVIQRRLVRQLYHLDHFLTNTRLQLSAALTSWAVENNDDAGMTSQHVAQIYKEVQQSIVQCYPDEVLVSTHHAFHFLVNTIRIAISPDPPHTGNDDMICVMLRCRDPLGRCKEFLAADSPSAPGKLRRQFMSDMEVEKEKVEDVVFGGERKGGRRKSVGEVKWRIGEVWFEVAKVELAQRGLARHSGDGVYRFAQGMVVVGCPGCEKGN